MGQNVDSLVQVAIFWLQQRRVFTLKGAVGVGVLPKLADHWELQRKRHTRQFINVHVHLNNILQ